MHGRTGKSVQPCYVLLWKEDIAVLSGLTGVGCTDKTAGWNKEPKRNMELELSSTVTSGWLKGPLTRSVQGRHYLHCLVFAAPRRSPQSSTRTAHSRKSDDILVISTFLCTLAVLLLINTRE